MYTLIYNIIMSQLIYFTTLNYLDILFSLELKTTVIFELCDCYKQIRFSGKGVSRQPSVSALLSTLVLTYMRFA
jgi:hypothetical protein